MAILSVLAILLLAHMVIGTAIMLDFMRRPNFRPWWQPMPISEFLRLWFVFAFGWSLAMITKPEEIKELNQ